MDRKTLFPLIATLLVALGAGVLRANEEGCMDDKNGTMNEQELRRKLTPEQYHVVRECGTEPPFRNAYWNNHEEGIYVDVVSGEPLFSSREKFDSGTGWPSFTAPLEKGNIASKTDSSFGMDRT